MARKRRCGVGATDKCRQTSGSNTKCFNKPCGKRDATCKVWLTVSSVRSLLEKNYSLVLFRFFRNAYFIHYTASTNRATPHVAYTHTHTHTQKVRELGSRTAYNKLVIVPIDSHFIFITYGYRCGSVVWFEPQQAQVTFIASKHLNCSGPTQPPIAGNWGLLSRGIGSREVNLTNTEIFHILT